MFSNFEKLFKKSEKRVSKIPNPVDDSIELVFEHHTKLDPIRYAKWKKELKDVKNTFGHKDAA